MAENYKLSLTAEEIDETLQKAGNAVLFTEQSLTDIQKQQVRENIEAVNVADQPVSQSILSEHLTWDGQSELGHSQISTNFYDYNNMSNIQITLQNALQYKIIEQRCNNLTELTESVEANLAEGESGLFFLRGSVYYFSTTSLVCVWVPNKNIELLTLLMIINDSTVEYNGNSLDPGTYFIREDDGVFISELKFDYKALVYNEDFKGIFKDTNAVNVYTLDLENFIDENVSIDLAALVIAELSKYKEGDVLLVPKTLFELLGQVT